MPDDLKHAVGDAVSARKLNGIVDSLPRDQHGLAALVGLLNQGTVRFRNDSTVRDGGRLVIVNGWDSVADPVEGKRTAVVTVADPEFPGDWVLVGVVVDSVPADEYGMVTTAGMVVAEFSSLTMADGWAMIDPADPAKLRSATGGFGRLIAQVDGTHAIVQMGHVQNLWQYKALTAPGGVEGEEPVADLTSADILDLAGATFASAVPVTFIGDAKIKPGDIGAAFQVTNGFACLAVGGFDCEDLCECDLEGSETGTCDPPVCCGDAALAAPTGFSGFLDDTDVVQDGEATARSSCSFEIPLDNGEIVIATYTQAGTWSIGYLLLTLQATSVDGVVSYDDGTDSFSFEVVTDTENCPPPPPPEDCEQCEGCNLGTTSLPDPSYSAEVPVFVGFNWGGSAIPAASAVQKSSCEWSLLMNVREYDQATGAWLLAYQDVATLSFGGDSPAGTWNASIPDTPHGVHLSSVIGVSLNNPVIGCVNDPDTYICQQNQDECPHYDDGVRTNGIGAIGSVLIECPAPTALSAADHKLGDFVRRAEPTLFRGGTCQGCRDVIMLMNGWGPVRTMDNLDRLVAELVRVTKQPRPEIKSKLAAAVQRYIQESQE